MKPPIAAATALALTLVLVTQACDAPTPSAPAKTAVLKVAVTTSTRDSGLLDQLLPAFEKARGARVEIIAVGTGRALALGRSADVDVVLVHHRPSELAFMKDRCGVRREDLMHNYFIIVGPEDDPGGIKGLGPEEALTKIRGRQRFISRGDDSGTHKREAQLWKAAGLEPAWDGYIESGRGMGATLIMADEKRAYTISDIGTYLKMRKKLALIPLVDKGEALKNPYGVLVVDPEKRGGDGALARAFVDYLISEECQRRIAEYRIEGQALFYPARGSKE